MSRHNANSTRIPLIRKKQMAAEAAIDLCVEYHKMLVGMNDVCYKIQPFTHAESGNPSVDIVMEFGGKCVHRQFHRRG
jgi:hypothetical protein